MADKYQNFEELAANEVYGVDYSIDFKERGTPFSVISPHAGIIEAATSELTRHTAGDVWSYFLFEGLKTSDNVDLHITSTNFDQPDALRIAGESEYALSYHGYKGTVDVPHTLIGGIGPDSFKNDIYQSLKDKGFSVSFANKETGFVGSSPDNFVNKTKKGMGVQLEISIAQRKAFFENNDWSKSNWMNLTTAFYEYVDAINYAIENVVKSLEV